MAILPFAPFSTQLDPSFWAALTRLKIDTLRLDDTPLSCTGSYQAGRTVRDKSTNQILSLPCSATFSGPDLEQGPSKRPALLSGTLRNYNTIEEFKKVDKQALLQNAADALWDDFTSGNKPITAQQLNPFIVVTFADLKKYRYYYWFAFPSFVANPAWEMSSSGFQPLQQVYEQAQLDALQEGYGQHSDPSQTSGFKAACIIKVDEGKVVTAALDAYDTFAAQHGPEQIALLALDASSTAALSWPLRNMLTFLSVRFGVAAIRVVAWRGTVSASQVVDVAIKDGCSIKSKPAAVGWEKNAQGKLSPKLADLGPMMDPKRLADQAVDLNLKLMRWRILPELDLDRISTTKCLLLGAGTLGCYVARSLMAWGVRDITLVDSATVSYSNPVRQPLFTFEDCLNGGKPKAECAADALERVYPGVNAKGLTLSIPMPGHPVAQVLEDQVQKQVTQLEQLIQEHDVVYLLMDSRESRWLPTMLGAKHRKLVMNAALGFDSFLVMRHGVPQDSGSSNSTPEQPQQLGCYFCSDITAARDSLSDRTLDQMCTVTRPGLAALASATAVELMASVIQHPLGARAPSDVAQDVQGGSGSQEPNSAEDAKSVLGQVPHQIRGFLAQFKNMPLTGHAYSRCTGCSQAMLDAYEDQGFDLLLKAFKDGAELEKVTGLDKLAEEMEQNMGTDWIEEADEEGDDF